MTDTNSSDRAFGEVTDAPEDNVQDSENNDEVVETPSEEVESNEETTSDKVETTDTKVEEPQLTEKGTKLDPNPQSAVHQQLANEKRLREQYEKVLSNPQMLSEYMKKQFGNTETKSPEVPITTLKEYKAEDFETLEDVANVVNSLQKGFEDKSKTYEEKIDQLKGIIDVITTQSKQQTVANTLKYETESVRNLPEFDPQSPVYVKGLEEKILGKFYELDFDESTGFFRGQYSLAKMVKDTIDNIKMGRESGSLKAQTIIKNKAEGTIKTSPKVDVTTDDESLSPEDSIARGIAKKFGR